MKMQGTGLTCLPCPRLTLTSVFLVFCVVLTAQAQSGRQRQMPKPADDTVHLRVEEVLLSVGVLNDSGKIPGRLAPSDITVIEDNRHHVVTSVRRTPANILLIMDNSGEFPAFKHYELNRDAALKVIDSLAEDDRAAIISYGGEVEVISKWTGDKKALRLAID